MAFQLGEVLYSGAIKKVAPGLESRPVFSSPPADVFFSDDSFPLDSAGGLCFFRRSKILQFDKVVEKV